MTRNLTCEDRIRGHLDGRLEDARAFNEILGASDLDDISDHTLTVLDVSEERGTSSLDELRETASERQWEYPLHVSVTRVVRIDLSTGGPGDWFEVHVDEDGEPSRIEYHFNDWFDHAARALDGDDYDTAAEFLRPFVEAAVLS